MFFVTEHEVIKVEPLKRYSPNHLSDTKVQPMNDTDLRKLICVPGPCQAQHICLSTSGFYSCYLSDVLNIKPDVKGELDVMVR